MYVSSVRWQKSDLSLHYSVIEMTTAIGVGCQTGCSFRIYAEVPRGPFIKPKKKSEKIN